ncbi:hypothetical protein RvY_05062 [Ramazzottius varieornatus]|uniref:Transmembrane protein 17 n=1 Tax=Ramazzottius varieornatus TaxID=947166 RepID=A0A1D1V2U7_RAMVA|nr:hypothetical protein RvY_05062 [Ramazzottius varieornatus]
MSGSSPEHEDLRFLKLGAPIASHLGLQLLLLLNVWFFPVWFAVSCWATRAKHGLLDDVLVVLGPVLLALNTLFEGLRLFFGYLGNLSENPGALGGFLSLSIFLQAPLLIIQLTTIRFHLTLAEWILDCLLLAFVATEIVAGYFAYTQIAVANNRKILSTRKSIELDKINRT